MESVPTEIPKDPKVAVSSVHVSWSIIIHRHHTILEPIAYSWDIVDIFLPEGEVMEERQVEQTEFTPE